MAQEFSLADRFPPTNRFYGLSFWVQPLTTYKRAITAFSDPTFNPSGMATFEVGEKGVEISVNGTDNTFGLLQLTSSSSVVLSAFLCRENLTKTISLTEILRVLNEVDDRRPVNVLAIRGDPQLCFSFPFQVLDHGPAELFEVAMTDADPYEFRRFPTVSHGIEAAIPTKDFIPMLDEILASEIKPAFVTIGIDAKLKLQVVTHSAETDPSDRRVGFKWSNWAALKTATNLVDKCGIWLVTKPSPHVMFRFDLGEIGDLVFLKKAGLMYGKEDIRHLGTFCSFFSNESNDTSLSAPVL